MPRDHISQRAHPGVTYRHADGWRIFIPYSMLRDESRRGHDGLASNIYKPGSSQGTCRVQIGRFTVTLNHRTRSVHGYVPDSWRVDLNAGPVCADVIEFPQPELLAA